jgi:hypothetical protein
MPEARNTSHTPSSHFSKHHEQDSRPSLLRTFDGRVTCAQIADSPDGDALRTKKSAESITDGFPAPFPARGGTVDWGLALSGGGLRSAAFSIGAMKALYDLNLLDDIDVISSVSGGGYASYWLYSRYDGRDGTRFGDGAFSNTEFPVQVCTLANRSRFYPFIQMMAAGVTPRARAFRSYRRAIQRSFGTDSTRERSLNALNRQITETRAPFFILNTTLKKLTKREGEVQSKIDKSFEIAPTYRGNYKLGFAHGRRAISASRAGPTVSQCRERPCDLSFRVRSRQSREPASSTSPMAGSRKI